MCTKIQRYKGTYSHTLACRCVGCAHHPSLLPLFPKQPLQMLHTSGAEIARQVWGRATLEQKRVQGKQSLKKKERGRKRRETRKEREIYRTRQNQTTQKTERANCIAPRPRPKPRKGAHNFTSEYSLNNFHQTECLLCALQVLFLPFLFRSDAVSCASFLGHGPCFFLVSSCRRRFVISRLRYFVISPTM